MTAEDDQNGGTVNETPEPRCYGHVFDPAFQGGSHMIGDPMNGWPAHTWGSPTTGACQFCPDPVQGGDRYICVKGGILHARCVERLNASVVCDD